MRVIALLAIAGCGFDHGTAAGSGDGGPRDVPLGDVIDGSTSCTQHTLPPNINVDPAQWKASFLAAPAWSCTAPGTTTIDSAAGMVTSTSCTLGTLAVTNNVAQGSGPPVFVVRLRGLTLGNSHLLQLIGDKPIVLLVAGDVTVDTGASIDAGANGATAGPGGSLASVCRDHASGLGGVASSDGWGGGGGGFGTPGGQGCYDIINGGLAAGTADLVPLRGGCQGGTGNSAAAPGQAGGGGGGAFQISASGTISIGATSGANLLASGGGAPAFGGGGNGGGAGGGILLVSPAAAAFNAAGSARANGGAGSSGCNTCSSGNLSGQNGHETDVVPATDSSGSQGGGNGNDHGRVGGMAYVVAGTLVTAPGGLTGAQTGGRGGGGGGGGRIVTTTAGTSLACD